MISLLILLLSIAFDQITSTYIDETKDPIDCDLGSVDIGDDVGCLIKVQEHDLSPNGEGSTITVRNSLNLIDSGGLTSSCENPRISVDFVPNDFDSGTEYFEVFESLTTDPSTLIQRCTSSSTGCDFKICVTDEALSNDYAAGDSVDLTVYVSGGVDGLHHDGSDLCPPENYQIDSELLFKCTRIAVLCIGVACDDYNVCTEDSCDPHTGNCVYNDISDECVDTDACTIDSCDPVSGCIYTAINCDDSNECTTDSCDPASGCINTAIDCDDGNACTGDSCDTVLGCLYEAIDCNDNNECTTDSCDSISGCINTAIDCDDSNECTTDSCDTALGCINTAIDCDDGNACTSNSCDTVLGCLYETIDCNDNNKCTTDLCDNAIGCVNEAIICDDNDPCTIDSCDPLIGCIQSEKCSEDLLCDEDTGECVTDCGETAHFDWEDLMNDGTGKPNAKATLNITKSTLTLNIDVDIDYLGSSSADGHGFIYGTTYVIDFEDFNAHSDDIREPGNCQNRANVLSDANWDQLWSYSSQPNVFGHIGGTTYLAYPPSGLWSVSMAPDDICDTVQYNLSLSWSELTQCGNFDGTKKYITTVDDGITNEIKLSGTLYINVVSPFAHQSDFGFYRVYQLLSQPFEIVLSKTVYVIDEIGINLLTIDVIAVYKQDKENTFKLVILTESAEYLKLSRMDLGESLLDFDADTDTGLTLTDFKVSETAQSDCIQSKSYICSQLWLITAENAKCSNPENKYTDFSGSYSITFEAECRSQTDLGNDLKTYCDDWLINHEDEIIDSGSGFVVLSTDLIWRDTICDPIVFEIQFDAEMQFFIDSEFTNIASNTHLYKIGEDRIYVGITTNYPSDHYEVFNTTLMNVWICTFDPLISPYAISDGEAIGGCFSNTTDTDNFVGHNGHIYDKVNKVSLEGFSLDSSHSNIIQFEFIVPPKIQRDKLFVHSQIEVSLTQNGERRRRVLIVMDEANQMDHFVDNIGLIQCNENPKPAFCYERPQQPYPQTPLQKPFVTSLKSPWIIVIGSVLILVLISNIVLMRYTNGNNRDRVNYSAVKYADSSEFDEYSERAAINVVSSD